MTPHPQWICKQCNDHCIAGCQFPVARKPDGCLYTMNGKPLENAVWQQYESRHTTALDKLQLLTDEAVKAIKAKAAREQVLPFLEELASQSVSDARKREIIESLRTEAHQ